jgi:hypothetical protein
VRGTLAETLDIAGLGNRYRTPIDVPGVGAIGRNAFNLEGVRVRDGREMME